MTALDDLSEAELLALADKMEEMRRPWAFVPYGHPITLCPDGWLWKEKHEAGEWDYWSNKPWQMDFFGAGATCRQRMLTGANRVGKTTCPAVELSYHTAGEYSQWWKGARIDKPIMAWECATSNQKLRDVNQKQLLGPGGGRSPGGGMIPADRIKKITFRQCGVENVVDTIEVYFVQGFQRGISRIQCLTYEQGRKAFQGDKIDYIRLDEEPDPDNIKHEGIFGECQARIFDSRGHLVVTYTPLEGNTEILEHFYRESTGRWVERAGFWFDWSDVPHLDAKQREDFIGSVPPHERPARCRGEPRLGSGRAFTFEEENVLCEAFQLPKHCFWIAGHDFGLDHRAASVWLAIDRTTDVWYVVHASGAAKESIPTHVYALRSLGEWIPVAWPHDGHKTQYSLKREGGEEIRDMYRKAGANMLPYSARYQTDKGGPQSAEPILLEINTRARTGRLRIFNTPATLPLREEMRMFHRDERGKLVHKRDDYIKALMYGAMMSRYARQSYTPELAPVYQRSIAS